ncbi:transforming growth factor beta-1-induced transcript 1 protein isoform X1 [Bombyx mori]|uniref:transforming growth factor beta-1-induced transcript 1 protein isoform X1 n=1 Tax=Bombyx mori TaxID=7091 RepID=UPI002ED0C369
MSTKVEAPAVCNSCDKVIQGRIVTALNKKWHPEHFVCNTCRKPIDGAKFHQHNNGVHCVPCFTKHHSPRCHGCGDPITDRVIQALGVSWHAHHFVCGGCKKELGGGGFMEQAGRPYCSDCYADKFATRCKGCGNPIVDKAIIALDAKWHRDCFTCMVTTHSNVYILQGFVPYNDNGKSESPFMSKYNVP